MPETKKYYHNLDVDNNKVINLLLNPLTTVQRTAVGSLLGLLDEGYVCFDTTLNQQYFWDGAAWTTVTASTAWGSITGTLTAQTDLTAYLTSNYYPLSSNPAGYLTTAVGSVTANSPLASSGGTTPNITIQQASGSQAGYLSSADWTTFNNKWGLSGNAGTTASTNFIGTTDNVDFIIKRNNTVVGSFRSGGNHSLAGNVIINPSATGTNNITVGSADLSLLTSGVGNFQLATGGYSALTSGSYNIFMGGLSGATLETGLGNIAIGRSSFCHQFLTYNYSGNYNTAIGHNAGLSYVGLTTGSENTFLGYYSGNSFANTASKNIAIGSRVEIQDPTNPATTPTTGDNNIIIGNYIQLPNRTASNQLNIGNFIFGTGLSGTYRTVSPGKIGIGVTAPSEALHLAGNFRFSGALMPNNLPGTSGQVLTSAGAGVAPTWTTISTSSGTVTSVELAAGTGISLSGTNPITTSGTITVTNSAPDQVVSLGTTGTGLSVTGSYPSFTLENTLPDQTVALTSGTGISTSGTYPNFTITNTSPFTTPLTTKGDIYVRNGSADTRLAVGLDTQVLVADSTTSTGLKWATNTAATPTGYYGAWQDNVTQTAAVINTGYPMIFRTTDLSNGVSVVTNGTNLTRITFANTGIYNLQFSSQFQNTDNAQHDVTIWLRLNGTDVPGSSGLISVPARKSAGAGNEGHLITGWNYVLSVVGGEYYELVWSVSNTAVTMQYYAAGNPPPSTASVIMTVTQQSGIMAGTGLTAINSLTGAVQTITAGTSGTDFAVSSSGTTHTLNLPTASSTNRGAVSSTDWTTFNNKQPQLNGTGFVKASGTTISYDNSTYLTAAITSLGGLTGATQTFATGTTGTDFGISSSGTTHTFNLPTASATNTGKLSSADWTTFNNKPTGGSVYLLSDFSTSNTTATNTGLKFSIGANEKYNVTITGTCSKATSTTGLKVAVGAPTGCAIKGVLYRGGAAQSTALVNELITAINTLNSSGFATGIGVEVPFRMEFVVANGSTAGSIELQLATVTSNTATIYAYTKMDYFKTTGL